MADALRVGAGAPPVTDAASSCTGVGACSASAAATAADTAASSPTVGVPPAACLSRIDVGSRLLKSVPDTEYGQFNSSGTQLLSTAYRCTG